MSGLLNERGPGGGPPAREGHMKRCLMIVSMALLAGAIASAGEASYSLEQAVDAAGAEGRVLKSATVQRGEHRVHRVRVLTKDGRVKTLEFSAKAKQQARGDENSAR